MSASQRSPLLKLEKLQSTCHALQLLRQGCVPQSKPWLTHAATSLAGKHDTQYCGLEYSSPVQGYGSHIRPPAWLASTTHNDVASGTVPETSQDGAQQT